MNRWLIVGIAVNVFGLLAGVVTLIALGKDPTLLIAFVSPYLTILVPILAGQQKIDRIDKNVNGHLTELSRAAGIGTDDTENPKHLR